MADCSDQMAHLAPGMSGVLRFALCADNGHSTQVSRCVDPCWMGSHTVRYILPETVLENPARYCHRGIKHQHLAVHALSADLCVIPGGCLFAGIRQRRPWLLSSALVGHSMDHLLFGSTSAVSPALIKWCATSQPSNVKPKRGSRIARRRINCSKDRRLHRP